MKPAAFSYHRPATLEDALSLLAQHGYDAKVIAGGQSLAPMMNMRFAQPAHLIDLSALPQLSGATLAGELLSIGAMTRHHEVATSATVCAACPLLAEAAATIGHYAIRHRGTLGGSLAHADPAAQMPFISSTLGASIDIVGPAGARLAPAAEFLIAVMTTDLAAEEIIRTVHFPVARAGERHAFPFEAARATVGAEKVTLGCKPSMASEDFAFMAQQKLGAYIWMGVDGATPRAPLHNPHYDFNGDALATGAAYWVNVVRAFGATRA
ncbi:amidohydrolase [Caballeronia ptereochthonis]|uniref:Amidohydrolase n=2 Tax=Caballeronia ptereochthonis TaxID=1777144 RepID=A0A158ATV4_9BURK|nr:amidohydrolase [Caballeronia ptereochthonis]